MAFPINVQFSTLAPVTSLTFPPVGAIFHAPRVDLGRSAANWSYNFFLTATSTPQNVYKDGALTTPFTPTGVVTADAFGRFPAIYLDNTIAYKVQLLNAASVVQRTRDPYNPAMATTGQAQVVAAQGLVINAAGELTLTEAAAGGTGNELSITTGAAAALKIQGYVPGTATLLVDGSVTTGAQTAVFQSANRPGNELQFALSSTVAPAGTITSLTLTAPFTGNTSSLYTLVLSTGQVILGVTLTNGATTCTFPSTTITGTPTANFVATFSVGVSGWLPIQCDGVTYYAPIFHGNSFTAYRFPH